MKVETMVSLDLAQSAETAKRAEALGYDGVLTPETGHDPFLPLVDRRRAHVEASRSARRSRSAFPRSPMVTAQMAWDLQECHERTLPARARHAGEEPQRSAASDAVGLRAGTAAARDTS